MPRKGPVAQKDLKTYSVDEYPYMLTKPYGRLTGAAPDRYFRTFKEARDAMLKDLEALRHAFVDRLNDDKAGEAIAAVRYLVEQMPDTGALINQVVDPYSGIKYQAHLVKRGTG